MKFLFLKSQFYFNSLIQKVKPFPEFLFKFFTGRKKTAHFFEKFDPNVERVLIQNSI